MKTILVPTDFSATAANAARYAVALANQTGVQKVVLYHAYQPLSSVSLDPMVPVVMPMDTAYLKDSSDVGMESFKKELLPFCSSSVELETITELNLLTDGVSETCSSKKIDLIVMGITGGSDLEEILIGSNTLEVTKSTQVPVIIVPPNAAYTPVKEVVLACDFDKVVESTPVQAIKSLLDATKAQLLVLNLQYIESGVAEMSSEKSQLDNLFSEYKPEYFFKQNNYFTQGINDFVDEKKVDMIITIPKKHGWFDTLFKRSHTKQLAFHTHVPLMVVHD